jgi:hypothetical protein
VSSRRTTTPAPPARPALPLALARASRRAVGKALKRWLSRLAADPEAAVLPPAPDAAVRKRAK